jgi:hypothetical protein
MQALLVNRYFAGCFYFILTLFYGINTAQVENKLKIVQNQILESKCL